MRIVFACAALVLTIAARAQTAEIAARVIDDQGHPVADAVVVAVPTDGGVRVPPRLREGVVDQVNQEFTPKVTAIVVGTAVNFPNHDNIRHQVYSFSPAKRFELPLYAGVPAQAVVFDKAGVVVLGCNIHDWMIGYVYVSESPFFAKTDANGRATIADLPARTFVVRVWHPQMKGDEHETKREVSLAAGRDADVAFTLALAPQTRVRRAPGVEHGRHY